MTPAQLLCTLPLPVLFRNWTLHGAHRTKLFFCFTVIWIHYHSILCFSELFPLKQWFWCVFVGWTFWQWDVNFTSKFWCYDNWPNSFLHWSVLIALPGGISCEWWSQKIWTEWHVASFKAFICRNWGIPLLMSVKEGGLSVWIRTWNLRIRCRVVTFVDILKCNRLIGAWNRSGVLPWHFHAQRHIRPSQLDWSYVDRNYVCVSKEIWVYPGQYSGPRASATLAFCPSAVIAYSCLTL